MTVELYEEVTTLIIRTVQRDMYAKEISHLEQGRIMAGTFLAHWTHIWMTRTFTF